jgi:Phosphopantetheinyl transferase
MISLSILALGSLTERARSSCLAAFGHGAGAAERARMERLRREEDRLSYRLSHGFLRLVLAAEAGQAPEDFVIMASPNGKPVCPGGPYFNMSHAGDYMVVAMSREREVGVDVEVTPLSQGTAEPVAMAISDEDRPLLPFLAERQDHAETMLWSIKEAALKLTGDVMVDPGHVAVRRAGKGMFRVEPSRAARAPIHDAFVRQIRLDEQHVLSLATYEPVPLSQIAEAPECWRGPPVPNISRRTAQLAGCSTELSL